MSISKEVRIGLLVSVSIVVFFVGFYLLKGASVFSNAREFFCYYPNVDGLQASANIQVKGLNVGHVGNIELAGDKGVKVSLIIDKDIVITDSAVAHLASSDLLGTKVIMLTLGKGSNPIVEGAVIRTATEGSIVDNVSGELTPRLRELRSTIIALDTALASINSIVGEQNQRSLANAMANINTTSENLAKLSAALSGESEEIKSILHNANSITGNLAKQNDSIQRIVSNVSSVTRQMANAPIQKTFTDLQKTTSDLQKVIDKINTNQGSLGMLVNDKALYNNLNSSLKSLHSLMDDLQAHPKKYINVSVFGKKN